MYRMLYLGCSDKAKMKQLNLIQDDTCLFCEQVAETIKHVLFECIALKSHRECCNLRSWRDIFVKRNFHAIHFLTNILIGAWKCEKQKTLDYLNKNLSRWSKANIKIG